MKRLRTKGFARSHWQEQFDRVLFRETARPETDEQQSAAHQHCRAWFRNAIRCLLNGSRTVGERTSAILRG